MARIKINEDTRYVPEKTTIKLLAGGLIINGKHVDLSEFSDAEEGVEIVAETHVPVTEAGKLKSFSEQAMEYGKFTTDTILEITRSADAEGAEVDKLYGSTQIRSERVYPNISYTVEDFRLDITRLLSAGHISFNSNDNKYYSASRAS